MLSTDIIHSNVTLHTFITKNSFLLFWIVNDVKAVAIFFERKITKYEYTYIEHG